MDRPMGPRQPPPDKRHAAYEAIFSRPGAAHHITSQSYPSIPPNQPPYQFHHQYQQPQDRRTSFGSYTSTYSHNGYLSPQPQAPHPPYRQSYHSQPQQFAQQLPPPTFNHQPPSAYGYPPPNAPRARSLLSNSHSPGIIMPPPDEPPDNHPKGLTPAQAYQAQVYLDKPSASPSDRSRYRTSPAPLDRTQLVQSQNDHTNANADARARLAHEPPRLGINIETDDGRLGIDFGANNSSGNSSDQGTDDSSELPWAQNDHRGSETPVSNYNLRVDTYAAQSVSVRSSIASTSPLSSTVDDPTLVNHTSDPHRRLSDSVRSAPKMVKNTGIGINSGANLRRERSAQERSMSLPLSASLSQLSPQSGSNVGQRRSSSSRPSIPTYTSGSGSEGRNSPSTIIPSPSSTTSPSGQAYRHPHHHHRKTPIVYPALLSRVAEAFRERITLSDRLKDGLTYKDAFDGREAVDKIAYIIKTTDRNLALLLGRALDAQKFFHDVTYDHRLRDSAMEVYQFKTRVTGPYVSGELVNPDGSKVGPGMERKDVVSASGTELGVEDSQDMTSEEAPLPSGVFTLLTDCYSPTCSRDQLCYSIACPRRLEQQARLNMKPAPVLSKQLSKESLKSLIDLPEDGTLWVHSVPQEIVASVSETEKKRQEAINEVIYTERDFVRDLEYLRDIWMHRLQESDVIPASRRTDFIQQVFWNIQDIIAVNTRLRDALIKRQKSYAVVDRIGDIFIEHVPNFEPFVAYGAHQLYGKYEFEREKSVNMAFAQFVEATERLPESRKLELNAFLTKPTTRLARYPLLLETVLKHTPEGSTDKVVIPKVIAMIKEFLEKVNAETGKTENRFNLLQLENQLVFKPVDEVDLKLKEPGREIVYKGGLHKRDGEIQVYLFDHAILFAKSMKNKHHEYYRVYRRPIPLELLYITFSDDIPVNSNSVRVKKQQNLVKKTSMNNTIMRERVGSGSLMPVVATRNDGRGSFWINFIYLGKKSYSLILWANSLLSQRKLVESIQKQQHLLRERSMIFDTATLSEGFFTSVNKVKSAAPYHNGRRIVYGTDDGVYISDLRDPGQEPLKVLSLLEVSQVDVLEDYQLLIVLSERQVITFPLDALDPIDPMAGLKRAKRISSHTTFFKAGYCLNKMLVCIVKSSQLSSTFKVLEPIDQNIRSRSKPTFKKLLQGGHDTLRPFKEFYIPVDSTSIHYLKTKMCVGCSRGFEIVDLVNLETQGLLDPHDESLEFVRKRENLRPMALYRIQNEFLLCYDEFAFYVNKNGRRSRHEFMVYWEGTPSGFALHEPYILAFEPSFIEIRHIETGLLAQVIQGSNLRLLFADTPPSSKTNMVPQHMQPSYQGGGYGQLPPGHAPYPGPFPPQQPQYGTRDEILVCSDDKVFSLRLAGPGGQHVIPDNASWASLAR